MGEEENCGGPADVARAMWMSKLLQATSYPLHRLLDGVKVRCFKILSLQPAGGEDESGFDDVPEAFALSKAAEKIRKKINVSDMPYFGYGSLQASLEFEDVKDALKSFENSVFWNEVDQRVDCKDEATTLNAAPKGLPPEKAKAFREERMAFKRELAQKRLFTAAEIAKSAFPKAMCAYDVPVQKKRLHLKRETWNLKHHGEIMKDLATAEAVIHFHVWGREKKTRQSAVSLVVFAAFDSIRLSAAGGRQDHRLDRVVKDSFVVLEIPFPPSKAPTIIASSKFSVLELVKVLAMSKVSKIFGGS